MSQQTPSPAVPLLLVAVAFSGVVAGVLAVTHLGEVETPTTSPTMEALHALLQANPGNEALKEAIREEDAHLRAVFLARRARLRTGAFLLAGGLVVAALAARRVWRPRPPYPRPLNVQEDDAGWRAQGRRGLWVAAVVAVVLVVALLALTLLGRGEYPRDLDDLPAASTPPVDTLPDGGFTEHWPIFRGPSGQGHVRAGDWPRAWDGETGEGIVWRAEVPLPGKSSPVIIGNRIFLTGADPSVQEVLCYRRDTGDLLWRTPVEVPGGPDPTDLEVLRETGYAAATPAADAERVYAVFATADIAGVTHQGRLVWARNLGDPDNRYGLATSLLVHEGKVLFQFDRGDDAEASASSLLALDGRTGTTLWSTPRPVDDSWSTPLLVETTAGLELLTCGDPWVISYDPVRGEERWRARGLSGDVAPSPAYAEGLLVVTTEYARMLAIRTGGEGDVTSTHVAWTSNEELSDAPSLLTDGRQVLQVHSAGVLTCFDLESGELLWDDELPGSMWTSPLLVGETVYLFAEDGRTYLLRLDDEHTLEEAGGLGQQVHATPAFADGHIYVRGGTHLLCIGGGGQ